MKTRVIYGQWNPLQQFEGQNVFATVAIQTQFSAPYVWCCYTAGQDVPTLPSDFAVMPIGPAKELFDFQPGDISAIV